MIFLFTCLRQRTKNKGHRLFFGSILCLISSEESIGPQNLFLSLEGFRSRRWFSQIPCPFDMGNVIYSGQTNNLLTSQIQLWGHSELTQVFLILLSPADPRNYLTVDRVAADLFFKIVLAVLPERHSSLKFNEKKNSSHVFQIPISKNNSRKRREHFDRASNVFVPLLEGLGFCGRKVSQPPSP